mmetsp:Transcript_23852/g.35663  ORF Transcript_23852/g.35663 Transcript_23852/m.35663 type:complete len:86 (-) Transcript_23852:160-417(-)
MIVSLEQPAHSHALMVRLQQRAPRLAAIASLWHTISVSAAYVSLAVTCRREMMRVARVPDDSKAGSTPTGVAQDRARRASRQRAR